MCCSSGPTPHITFGENSLSSFNLLLGPTVLHQEPYKTATSQACPKIPLSILEKRLFYQAMPLLTFSPGASKPRKSHDFKNNSEHGRSSERIVVIFNINNIKRMAACPDDSGTWRQCSEATATPPFLGWLPLSPSLASSAVAFFWHEHAGAVW